MTGPRTTKSPHGNTEGLRPPSHPPGAGPGNRRCTRAEKCDPAGEIGCSNGFRLSGAEGTMIPTRAPRHDAGSTCRLEGTALATVPVVPGMGMGMETRPMGICAHPTNRWAQHQQDIPGGVGPGVEELENGQLGMVTASSTVKLSRTTYRVQVPTASRAAVKTSKSVSGWCVAAGRGRRWFGCLPAPGPGTVHGRRSEGWRWPDCAAPSMNHGFLRLPSRQPGNLSQRPLLLDDKVIPVAG